MDSFITHWGSVNSFLASGSPPLPPPLVLTFNRTVALFTGLRTTLTANRLDVQLKLNLKEIARADVEIKRALIVLRMDQFNNNVRSSWAGNPVASGVRALPSKTDSAAIWEDAMDDVQSLWATLNTLPAPVGVTLPLVLPSLTTTSPSLPPTYSQASFATEAAAVKAAHTALQAADANLKLARAVRTATEELALPYFPLYRTAVEGRIPADHPLIAALPRYSPLPGSTPNPANASGSWDPVLGMAVIVFSPSSSANVVRYELRFVSGPDYHTDDESSDSSILASAPHRFQTLSGLPAAGTIVSCRVYAITADGNEKGSNTVVILRP